MQTVKKLSNQRSDKGSRIYRSETNGFDCRKAKHCVIYTVTSYPDYSDYAQHITHIYITDPAIEFYGLSRNSSFEEFDYIMKNQGFEITRAEEHCHSFEKGSYWVSFTKDYISIGVRVTNKEGIDF